MLCYLSIGEAENYRFYWNDAWSARAPEWLGAENAAWKGNYHVNYWDPAWQRLIVDRNPAPASWPASWIDQIKRAVAYHPATYLDRILDAGFDGVLLDRVDAFDKASDQHATAQADMISFVRSISDYGRTRRPGFLVVPQNGEELLSDASYRTAIDGVAKEDLFYGETGDGVANPPDDTRQNIGLLRRAKADGLPVFVIEYVADAGRQREIAENLRALGFVGLFGERGLKSPPVVAPVLAGPGLSPTGH